MDKLQKEQQILRDLRKKIFLAGYKGGMAHIASCYSCLELLYTLYLKGILKIDKTNPGWENRDRFILSKGHAGLALYAVMFKAGLLSEEEFDSYLQPEGIIGGEPCMRDSKWVEATTGSLGHGLSFAVGVALALKSNKSQAKVYVLLGDGECEEGTVWEAAMSAAAFKLDNLITILDCNTIQKMDFVKNTIGEPDWGNKWSAFGWSIDEVNGHSIDAIVKCLLKENEKDKPRFVIAHTIKGKGVSIMENNPGWHFKLPNKKELRVFKSELTIMDSELE